MQTPDQTCPWGFPDGLLTSFISSLFIPSPTNKLKLLNLPPHAGTLLSQVAASPWAAGLLLHSLPSGDEIPGRKQSSTVSLHGEAGPVVPMGRPWCTAGQGGRTARQHGLCSPPQHSTWVSWRPGLAISPAGRSHTLLPFLPLPCFTKSSGFNAKFSRGFPEGSMQKKSPKDLS